MKKPEYIEGNEAQRNFEEGIKSLFKVPKDSFVQAEKKRKRKRAVRDQSVRKQLRSDKD